MLSEWDPIFSYLNKDENGAQEKKKKNNENGAQETSAISYMTYAVIWIQIGHLKKRFF